MATQVKTKSQLQLIFEEGLGENGEAILKRKTFNRVNTAATPEQLYAVSQALASLQTFPLLNVVRNDSFDVTEI
ncbi:DUF1659 domain-containing protein [Filobacillus milosensis]|uniref:DUF1659 domain-containing protein n=1 Tax=Filobacillus milosensis TaxID=94137 RepID=A0A4Y8IDP5_9BACI|nr:DUF1659 domain-containing protein [Filobacillus milosensis]TFB14066.1 DUF1659 domain-containing protein [Filobacillus milosensis]